MRQPFRALPDDADPRNIDPRDVTLAVLAGGAGSRMGGPKAWLRLRDRPILLYLAERFAWTGPTLLVTAPGLERPPGREAFAAEVTDPVVGEGPLRGVLTALEHCPTPYLVITTVDMPRVRPLHFRWLVSSLAARRNARGSSPCATRPVKAGPSRSRAR